MMRGVGILVVVLLVSAQPTVGLESEDKKLCTVAVGHCVQVVLSDFEFTCNEQGQFLQCNLRGNATTHGSSHPLMSGQLDSEFSASMWCSWSRCDSVYLVDSSSCTWTLGVGCSNSRSLNLQVNATLPDEGCILVEAEAAVYGKAYEPTLYEQTGKSSVREVIYADPPWYWHCR